MLLKTFNSFSSKASEAIRTCQVCNSNVFQVLFYTVLFYTAIQQFFKLNFCPWPSTALDH